MNKYPFIIIMAILAVITVISNATAKDRLWMAREAVSARAIHQEGAGNFLGASSGKKLAGERLWMARERALRQSERTRTVFDMAGSQKMNSGQPDTSEPQKELICEKNKPTGPPLFFRGYGHVATARENCG